MQPYVFPYIGYFQLIHAVDTFVFFDDVNYYKRGWINRNRILLDGKDFLFTVPLSKASQNKRINVIDVQKETKWLDQLLATIQQAYSRAPNFKETMKIIESVFTENFTTISDLAIISVKKVSEFLEIETNFELSSQMYPETDYLKKADRLIAITHKNGSEQYINPSGGVELYSKDYFLDNGVQLSFIENELVPYSQFKNEPITGLSIIDVLMFNTKLQVASMLNKYKLN